MRREKSRLKKAAGRISCAITRTEEDESQVANGAPAANTKNLNKPQAASGGPGGETKNEDKRFYSSLVVSSRCGILFFVSRPFNIFARLFAVSSSLDLFCHALWLICSSFIRRSPRSASHGTTQLHLCSDRRRTQTRRYFEQRGFAAEHH